MTDDPFARAAARVESADAERSQAHRGKAHSVVGAWASTGFRIHFAVYIAVNLLLVTIWATTTPGGYPWFLYVLLGWGIGIAAHYAAVSHWLHPKR